MKDKRKFGGASKNRNCKKFGYSYDKDVAEVVEWHHPECIGSIIQRYKDIIIFIGKPSGNSYPTLFESGEFLKKCKVRILSPRSLIML